MAFDVKFRDEEVKEFVSILTGKKEFIATYWFMDEHAHRVFIHLECGVEIFTNANAVCITPAN